MQTFPDDESIGRLQRIGVKYVLVHQAFYKPGEYADLMGAAAGRSELVPSGRYRDWVGGETQIFELRARD